jgi:excisionase family DNA binding protein
LQSLTTLTGLAVRLGLPRDWLRAEALAGRIPCLKVGRKMRFNPDAVEQTLAARAAAGREEPRPARKPALITELQNPPRGGGCESCERCESVSPATLG